MKRTTVIIALAILMLTGCKHKNYEFDTYYVNGEKCWLQIFDEPFIFDEDTLGVMVTYSFMLPEKGVLSPAAERELMDFYFGDNSVTDVNKAVEKWISQPFFFKDENARLQPVDSLGDDIAGISYLSVESSCSRDSVLATFFVMTEMSPCGAAHGIYSENYLTVDLETGNVIHLEDLVADTTLLCEAIARAIQDLEVNSDIIDCLYDEFREVERMPLPNNFVIDSDRNGITVYYDLYKIAPYACGIQEVTLPIFWLSKHVPLTPYAKQFFGPGCSIE